MVVVGKHYPVVVVVVIVVVVVFVSLWTYIDIPHLLVI